MTLSVQILGGVLVALGIYLILAKALGSQGTVQLPGVAINVPGSVLVLLLGVGIFLFPLSPWWPEEAVGSSGTTPTTTTVGAAPASGETTTTTPETTTTTEEATTTTAETTTTAGSTTTTESAVTLPAAVVADCIPYDPATLQIEDLGDLGWRLNSSTSAMLLLDDRDDAERALALAQLHTQQCFIGRGNNRPNRIRYILGFWTGDDGGVVEIPGGAIPDEDCIGYDPDALTIEDLGDQGWRLNSGSIAMVLLDDEEDAVLAMELAGYYRRQCFIGRDNGREDRFDYIVDYWR